MPKHCSWLNQVEIRVGSLGTNRLRRGSFTSVADREAQVSAFIAYDNRTRAKPVRWTDQGKTLVA